MLGARRSYLNRIVIVDVEADGNIIGKNSMVCFGAVKFTDPSVSFYGQTAPLSDKYNPEALAVSGFSREEHEEFDSPLDVMKSFYQWLEENFEENPILFSDNPQFDGAWINYYLLTFIGDNPFGWSSRRIGDLWCGFEKNLHSPWKHLRDTEHTHNPVDDATGNAEALMKMLIWNKVIKLKKGDRITFKHPASGELMQAEVFSVNSDGTIAIYPIIDSSGEDFIEYINLKDIFKVSF